MNQIETIIHFRKKMIKLLSQELPDTIDIEELTSINYSNLFGEAITCPVALNKIGNLMSEAEAEHGKEKIKCEMEVANVSKNNRKLAASDEKKITEKAVEEQLISDPKYKQLKYSLIDSERNLNFIKNLFFALKSKDEKLNVLMKGVKPEDYENELTEGIVNTYMIKIHKKKYSE